MKQTYCLDTSVRWIGKSLKWNGSNMVRLKSRAFSKVSQKYTSIWLSQFVIGVCWVIHQNYIVIGRNMCVIRKRKHRSARLITIVYRNYLHRSASVFVYIQYNVLHTFVFCKVMFLNLLFSPLSFWRSEHIFYDAKTDACR